jgi:hypothetical protein
MGGDHRTAHRTDGDFGIGGDSSGYSGAGGGGWYGGGGAWDISAWGGGGSSYTHPNIVSPIKGDDNDWPLFVNEDEAKAVSSENSATQLNEKYQPYTYWSNSGSTSSSLSGYRLWKPDGEYKGIFNESQGTIHHRGYNNGLGKLIIQLHSPTASPT